MVKRILIIGLFLIIPAVAANNPTPPHKVFDVGEKLIYNVRWFIIPAGNASLEVKEIIVINDWPCYRIIAKAQSRILFFFKVEDRIESYSTMDELLPILFEKHLREGKYKKDLVVPFNLQTNTAAYENQIIPVGPGYRDPLGAFYYFRTLKLPEPGGEIGVNIHTDKQNYPLLVKVLKRDKVRVPAGEFNTVIIELRPYPGFEGIFRHEGDIKIWVTDDNQKIPVKIRVKVPILGSVNIELAEMAKL